MESSLTLKLGRNHSVKDVCAGRQQLWALTPWLSCLFWGFRLDFCFFLSGRGGQLTSAAAAFRRLPLHVCFTHVCHRLHCFAPWLGPCFTDSGLASPQEVFVSVCVFRCVRQSCCFSLPFVRPAGINRLRRENSCPRGRPFPLCLYPDPVPGQYIPSSPHPSHRSIAPRLSPLSADSIPQCNSLPPCGSL